MISSQFQNPSRDSIQVGRCPRVYPHKSKSDSDTEMCETEPIGNGGCAKVELCLPAQNEPTMRNLVKKPISKYYSCFLFPSKSPIHANLLSIKPKDEVHPDLETNKPMAQTIYTLSLIAIFQRLSFSLFQFRFGTISGMLLNSTVKTDAKYLFHSFTIFSCTVPSPAIYYQTNICCV